MAGGRIAAGLTCQSCGLRGHVHGTPGPRGSSCTPRRSLRSQALGRALSRRGRRALSRLITPYWLAAVRSFPQSSLFAVLQTQETMVGGRERRRCCGTPWDI